MPERCKSVREYAEWPYTVRCASDVDDHGEEHVSEPVSRPSAQGHTPKRALTWPIKEFRIEDETEPGHWITVSEFDDRTHDPDEALDLYEEHCEGSRHARSRLLQIVATELSRKDES